MNRQRPSRVVPSTSRRPASCAQCVQRPRGAFCVLTSGQIGRLAGRACTLYRKGQIVFHAGAPPLACYCVYSGRVKLFRMSPSGQGQIVAVAGPSELLGYQSLWTQRPFPVTAEMMDDGYLCVIERSVLCELVKQSPALGQELLRRTALELEEAQSQLTDRSFRSARSRLAAALLRLWEGREAGDTRPLVLSRQDLADIIGTAQETAIRLLAELKQAKAVSVRGSRISVLRPELLRTRSQPPF